MNRIHAAASADELPPSNLNRDDLGRAQDPQKMVGATRPAQFFLSKPETCLAHTQVFEEAAKRPCWGTSHQGIWKYEICEAPHLKGKSRLVGTRLREMDHRRSPKQFRAIAKGSKRRRQSLEWLEITRVRPPSARKEIEAN